MSSQLGGQPVPRSHVWDLSGVLTPAGSDNASRMGSHIAPRRNRRKKKPTRRRVSGVKGGRVPRTRVGMAGHLGPVFPVRSNNPHNRARTRAGARRPGSSAGSSFDAEYIRQLRGVVGSVGLGMAQTHVDGYKTVPSRVPSAGTKRIEEQLREEQHSQTKRPWRSDFNKLAGYAPKWASASSSLLTQQPPKRGMTGGGARLTQSQPVLRPLRRKQGPGGRVFDGNATMYARRADYGSGTEDSSGDDAAPEDRPVPSRARAPVEERLPLQHILDTTSGSRMSRFDRPDTRARSEEAYHGLTMLHNQSLTPSKQAQRKAAPHYHSIMLRYEAEFRELYLRHDDLFDRLDASEDFQNIGRSLRDELFASCFTADKQDNLVAYFDLVRALRSESLKLAQDNIFLRNQLAKFAGAAQEVQRLQALLTQTTDELAQSQATSEERGELISSLTRSLGSMQREVIKMATKMDAIL